MMPHSSTLKSDRTFWRLLKFTQLQGKFHHECQLDVMVRTNFFEMDEGKDLVGGLGVRHKRLVLRS